MAVITEEQLFPSNVVCWGKRRASVTHVLWIILLPASILFSENKGPKVDLLLPWILVPISESPLTQSPMSIASVMWAESLIRCFRSVYPYQRGKMLDPQLKYFILRLVSGHRYCSPHYFCLSRYHRNRYSDIYPSSTQT